MIANLIIIAFVLGMAYIWSVYGLFSGFLQLILVIAAGAIALGVWEPLALGFLMGRMPAYAWGVGLLGPFVLSLIIMRAVCDVVVRKNVIFPNLVNQIGGAATGLLSGILIAGLAWVGLNFLPLKSRIAGAQDYQVALNGQVEPVESGGLWFGVDEMAVNFFNGLSGGAFSTAKPLRLYQPDLAWQAGVYRLHTDPNASAVARPTGVNVTAIHAQPTPVAGLDAAIAEAFGAEAAGSDRQLVVVDTTWQRDPGTYDADSAVRIAPSQVRLVVFQGPSRNPRPVLIPPRGYSRIANFESGERTFHPLTTDQADARTNQQTETFGFVFLAPADAEPKYALIRHLRVNLPPIDRDPEPFAKVLGKPAAPVEAAGEGESEAPGQTPDASTPAGSTATSFSGQFASEIVLTNALVKPFNRNSASALRYNENAIESGDATASGQAGSLASRTRVNAIYVPAHSVAVRMTLAADSARGIFGRALDTARSAAGVWLTDERGQQHRPIAWVLLRGEEQLVHVDLNQPIQSANQLPISQMSSGQSLYLYFAVPKPSAGQSLKITGYQIGDKNESIEPPLEVK